VKKKLAHFRLPAIKKALSKLEKTLREYDLANGNNVMDLPEIPKEIARPLEALSKATLSLNKEPHPSLPDSYKNLSREAHRFAYLDENYPTETMLYGQREGSDYVLHLYCPDPSDMLKASLSPLKGRIIFSATLSPISYYMDAIMKSHDWPYLFCLRLFRKRISFAPRPDGFDPLQRPGEKLWGSRRLPRALRFGEKRQLFPLFPVLRLPRGHRPFAPFPERRRLHQERDMDDEEKSLFLSRFLSNPAKTTIGLC
jgi:DNA excision repair protein ERCC-2